MTAIYAFLASIAGYAAITVLFPALGLLDFPERYGMKREKLPYPAGIVAVVIFLFFFLWQSEFRMQQIGVVCALSLLGIMTFVDDRHPLPPLLRLFIQTLAAITVFVVGSRIYTITNPLGGILKLDSVVLPTLYFGNLPLWSGVFTVFWLLLTTNALNWLDGIPGQVSIVSAVAFLMLGLLALYRNGEPGIAEMAFILGGIALAGSLFDIPPAKVVMGDTGSMFFGFMLGLLGIYSGGKVATVFLALGLPLFDSLFVIIRRLSRGDSPLKGGRDHLHHLLLDAGFSERKVIVLTASVGTLFGLGALFMNTSQKGISILALGMIVALLTRYVNNKKKVSSSDQKPSGPPSQ